MWLYPCRENSGRVLMAKHHSTVLDVDSLQQVEVPPGRTE